MCLLLLLPNEAFAMEPSYYWVTNYYGDKEYIGPNTYAYFHLDSAPDINTIQSRVSPPYGSSIKDDSHIIKSTSSIHKLDSKPLYELDGKPIYKSINAPYDRYELHFWTPGQSITRNPYSNYVIYYFELNTGSIKGTISISVDSVTWHRRNHNNMEIIRDYCTYVDTFPKNKNSILSKVSLYV